MPPLDCKTYLRLFLLSKNLASPKDEKNLVDLHNLNWPNEDIQKYLDKKWGDRGEYFTLQRELVKPIFDKINAVLTRIGEEEEFDYIFDTSQGFILYAKDKYDLTDKVILELEKEAPATPTKK